jgi:outer membrane protein assembly factor BamD (BamD/ComL family)
MALGDDPNAAAGVEKLATNFAGGEDLPETLYEIAGKNERAKKYEEAKSIYERIISEAPESWEAVKAEVDIAKVDVLALIGAGNAAGVEQAVDGLIASFDGHPHLAEAVFQVGKGYHDDAGEKQRDGDEAGAMGLYPKAIGIWEIILERFSESEAMPKACYLSGDCYRLLGRNDEAVRYYEEIAANWPDYDHAWAAQYQIGCCYIELRNAGTMAEREANAKIKAAYRELLEKYPDCVFADNARGWLAYQRKLEGK